MNVENAIKKVKDNLDRFMDKNMTDMIRGIRNNKENEAKYISQCIDEIKLELKQDNMSAKANAILKLIYLNMLGYSINWASFNIVEVMSSPKFTFKRMGYLAASQTFNSKTDVLMLTTNLIKKDINSSNQYEAAIALNGFSCFVTHELARDLANDINCLISSSKPYIRKRAILMMYKIFLNYPDSLETCFPKLKEKLEDQDQSVQSAVVNVICEMARKNPRNYLSLAPIFFKIMTSSTNNWMLIKIIKLFGTLTTIEPRLGKKLLEPLTSLIHSTSAMSLLYECINTLLSVLVSISSGKPDHSASIQLCLQKLRILIEDNDQNLKYLGLLAMSKILKTYPKSVQAHKDIVLKCLDDKDDSIRLRALHLLYGMVNKKTLMDIVKTLLKHLYSTEISQNYKDELLKNIINVCSQNNYQHVTDFQWYLDKLIEFTRLDSPKNIDLICTQLLDVTIRVPTLRKYSVLQLEKLFEPSFATDNSEKGPHKRMSEIYNVSAFVCGEYSQYLSEPHVTVCHMLNPRILNYNSNVQISCLWNTLKILSKLIIPSSLSSSSSSFNLVNKGDNENMEDFMKQSISNISNNSFNASPNSKEYLQNVCYLLQPFMHSNIVEIQERALLVRNVIEYFLQTLTMTRDEPLTDYNQMVAANFLYSGDLNPVAPKAQYKVLIPDGLDLDECFNPDFEANMATNSQHAYRNYVSGFGHFEEPKYQNRKNGFANRHPKSGNSESDTTESNVSDNAPNANSIYTPETPSSQTKKSKIKKKSKSNHHKHIPHDMSDKDILKMRELRLQEQASNPHYLKSKITAINPDLTPKVNGDIYQEEPNDLMNSTTFDITNNGTKSPFTTLSIAEDLISETPNHIDQVNDNGMEREIHRVQILNYEAPDLETKITGEVIQNSRNPHKKSSRSLKDKKHSSKTNQKTLPTPKKELLDFANGVDTVEELENLKNDKSRPLLTNLNNENHKAPLNNDINNNRDLDYDFWLSPSTHNPKDISETSKHARTPLTHNRPIYEPFASDDYIVGSYHVSYEPSLAKCKLQLKFEVQHQNLISANHGNSDNYPIQIKHMEFMFRTSQSSPFEIVNEPYISYPLKYATDYSNSLLHSSSSLQEGDKIKDCFFLKVPNELILSVPFNTIDDASTLNHLIINLSYSLKSLFNTRNDSFNDNGDFESPTVATSLDIENIENVLFFGKGYFSYNLFRPNELNCESYKLDYKLQLKSYDCLYTGHSHSEFNQQIISTLKNEASIKLQLLSTKTIPPSSLFQNLVDLLQRRMNFKVVESENTLKTGPKADILFTKSLFDPNIYLFLKMAKLSEGISKSNDRNGGQHILKVTAKGNNNDFINCLIKDLKIYLKITMKKSI